MRTLLVEDEVRLASYLKRGLEREGFAVDVAADGEEGLWLASNQPYDAIVLARHASGKIWLELRRNDGNVELLVSDDGPGILEQDWERVSTASSGWTTAGPVAPAARDWVRQWRARSPAAMAGRW